MYPESCIYQFRENRAYFLQNTFTFCSHQHAKKTDYRQIQFFRYSTPSPFINYQKISVQFKCECNGLGFAVVKSLFQPEHRAQIICFNNFNEIKIGNLF